MPVTVISKRFFKIDKDDKLVTLLNKLRKHAKKQKGFISRTTFANIQDTTEKIVISEWKTEKHWRKWMKDKEVQKIQGKIDSCIGEKTIFNIYKPESY